MNEINAVKSKCCDFWESSVFIEFLQQHERRWSWQLIFYFFFFFKTRAIMLLAHRCQSTHLTHTTSSCFFPTRIFNPGTPLCRARIWHVLSFLNELRSTPLLNNALKKCTTSFWASISIDLGKTLFCVLMLTSLGVWNIVKGSIG